MCRAIAATLDYQHFRPAGLLGSLQLLLRLCQNAVADAGKRTARRPTACTRLRGAASSCTCGAQVDGSKLHGRLAGECKPELALAVLAAAGWRHKVRPRVEQLMRCAPVLTRS